MTDYDVFVSDARVWQVESGYFEQLPLHNYEMENEHPLNC